VFSNFWSIYGSRKILLGKEVLILSGKNLTVLTSNKKTTFLISEVCFTYKFIILDIKRKQNIFFGFFFKYWPSSHGSNKLVIKAKMHDKTYFKFFYFFLYKKKWYFQGALTASSHCYYFLDFFLIFCFIFWKRKSEFWE
jgi:hypothetical protein